MRILAYIIYACKFRYNTYILIIIHDDDSFTAHGNGQQADFVSTDVGNHTYDSFPFRREIFISNFIHLFSASINAYVQHVELLSDDHFILA